MDPVLKVLLVILFLVASGLYIRHEYLLSNFCACCGTRFPTVYVKQRGEQYAVPMTDSHPHADWGVCPDHMGTEYGPRTHYCGDCYVKCFGEEPRHPINPDDIVDENWRRGRGKEDA